MKQELAINTDFLSLYSIGCLEETAFHFIGQVYLDANKKAGEEAGRQLHKNVVSNIEQVLEATPHKAPTIRPPASHHENYPS